MDIFTWAFTNFETVVTALLSILSGLITISLLIPGDHPEKTFYKIADFLKRISRK